MSIEIREHAPGGDIGDFLRAGEVVFRDDPQWVPPLKIDIEKLQAAKQLEDIRVENKQATSAKAATASWALAA
jgi:hypothetical protein